jgi:hypothetical protein
MIKLTSFYPFSSLLRITHEFHDDKVVVKTKSLTFEHEFEFDYNKVNEISDSYHAPRGQIGFSYFLLFFISLALSFFNSAIYANPVLLRGVQIIFICGVLLFITSFIKGWYIILSDKDGDVLTTIKQTRRNCDLILKVTEIIKGKSENMQEISTADPFPEIKPAFEYAYLDISDLERTTDKFYEKEIIGFEKNWFSEKAYTIKYSALSGKIFKGKIGNSFWCLVSSILALVIFVMGGFLLGFRIHYHSSFIQYTFYIFGIIFLVSWLIQFVKRETIGFYNKNENVEYWAFVKQADKDKFEKIIEYVQSRIPAENKEIPLKE